MFVRAILARLLLAGQCAHQDQRDLMNGPDFSNPPLR